MRHENNLLRPWTGLAVLLAFAACRPHTGQSTPPVASAQVEPAEAATAVASTDPPALEVVAPCVRPLKRTRLDACLKDVVPRGEVWARVRPPFPPEAYFCVYFGSLEQPRCNEGDAEAVETWVDASDGGCRKTMTVYWAPMESPKTPRGEVVPGTRLRIRQFDTDGSWFAFIRVNDHVVEATSCVGGAQELRAAAVEWAHALDRLDSDAPDPAVVAPAP